MEKKILVALDDSENALRAVEFVSQTFTPDHEITLFSVIQGCSAHIMRSYPEEH